MMKTLRIRLFQETACYKKASAYKVGETYPLPPYATVKGMLHQVLGADRYIPMRLSIQGKYDNRIVDYQRHYFFKRNSTLEFPLVLDGLALRYDYHDMTTMPIYMHMLHRVELVVHVQAEDDILESLRRALLEQGPAFSLGRWEDLVRVDECKYISCAVSDNDEWETPLPIYMPVSLKEDINGVPYRLNWTYEIVQGVRQWNRIAVRYVPAGEWIGDGVLLCDEDGYPVAIPKEMEA